MKKILRNGLNLGTILLAFFLGWKYAVGLILGCLVSAIVFFYPDSFMGVIYQKMFNINNSIGGTYYNELKKETNEKNKFKVRFK